MANTTYNINVNTSGAIVNITNLQSSMGRLHSTAMGLSTVFAGMISMQSISSLTTMMDAATNLQNRLKGVQAAGQSTDDVLKLMSKSSMEMGVSLNDLGNSYASIANATKDLGYSQKTNIMLNDTLTKSLLINGATAQQVNSAYYQFGQIMAKGKSEGDDFNSMLEAAPGIIRAMSDQLNTTTGGLRYMSQQGKLTAEVWKNAMEKSGESIDKAFKERIPTIGQSMERLKTAFEIKLTGLDKATGTSEALSLALIKIANAMLDVIEWTERWGKIIGGVIEVIALIFIPLRIVRALFGAMEAAALSFGGRWNAIAQTAATFTSAFDKIKVWIIGFLDLLFPNLQRVTTMIVALGSSFLAFTGLKNIFDGIGDLFSSDKKEAASKYSSELDKLNKRLGIDNVEANNKASEASDKKTEKDLKNADTLKKSLGELQQAYSSAVGEFQNTISGIGATKNASELLDAQKKAADDYTASVKKLKEELQKNGSIAGSKEETEAVKKLSDEYGKQLNQLEALNKEKQSAMNVEITKQSLKDLGESYSEFARNMQNSIGSIGMGEQAANFYESQKQAAESYYSAVKKLQEDFKQNGTAGSAAEKEAIDKLSESYNQQVEVIRKLTAEKENATRAQQLLTYSISEAVAANEKLADIQDQMSRLGMSELEKKYSDIDIAARKSAENAIKAEQARRGEMDETGKAYKNLSTAEVKAYYEAATKGSAKLREETKKLYDSSRTFATGWKQAFTEYVDSATNSAEQAKSIFNKFTTGLEDSLVNLVKTGKFTWKEFVTSMAEDLLRSQIKQTLGGIIGLLTGQGTGGGGGGILGAIGSLFGLGTGASGASGKSANDPVYVYDISSGGKGGAGGTGGAGGSSTGILGSLGKSIGNFFGDSSKDPTGTHGVLQSDQNSWWDGITSGISDIFGGNDPSGTFGVLQSDQNSWLDDIGNFFGGLFANGGTLGVGKWGIAGEAGMELVKQANGLMRVVGANGPEVIKGPAEIISNKDLMAMGATNDSGFAGMFANGTTGGIGSLNLNRSGNKLGQSDNYLQQQPSNTTVTYHINAVDAKSFKQMIAADPSFIYAVSMQGAKGVRKI